MRRLSTALLFALPIAASAQATPRRPAPPELPGVWTPPPGDPVEHEAAGFAKVLCSAVFVTGRDPKTSAEEDGYFVSPMDSRRLITDTIVDRARQMVRVRLPNGVWRAARYFGDQGCVTLPRDRDSVDFAPHRITSKLPPAATTPWPMGDLVRPQPLPSGIDAAKLKEALDAAMNPASALTAAYLVVYKGQIIGERYQEGLDHTTRLPGWSMGKSVTATIMARLIQEKHYDLWQPAPIAEWQSADDPRRNIRIADVFRMSSGLRIHAPQDPDYDRRQGYPDHLYFYTGAIDAQRWAITRAPAWPANTVGRYRNTDPLTLSYLIRQDATTRHEDYLGYPQKMLFDEIGVRRYLIEPDVSGGFMGQGYEHAPARDWARIAMLYLTDGVWNGKRLLPPGFVDFVRTPAPAWDRPEYGGMFWLNRVKQFPVPDDAFMMEGVGGQYTLIIPSHDLVVVRLGHYKGARDGLASLKRSLELLIQAIPQSRPVWQPPVNAR